MDSQCLVGLNDRHLVPLTEPGHYLQAAAKRAFVAMQTAALEDGFHLAPASSFRSFSRQLLIWNDKFVGNRPLLDAHSQPLNVLSLSEPERITAILQWSALPGTSRHHWGTDIDIYDPQLLPKGARLQLEPWEYEADGYFYPLSLWLEKNMARFGFYLPFINATGGVAREPWHISYRPLADEYAKQLTPSLIAPILAAQPIYGKEHILSLLDDIFARFIHHSPEE